ncbi:MAG: hypothetical protein J7J96_00030 [Sulfurimonas sp.]|nr:hypothetical protein [Sulfurimonas sp.]
MILDKMKDVISYSMELDINYLEIFMGYKGDKVLKITSKSRDAIDKIEAYLNKLDLEFKSEFDVSGKHDSSFNLYVGVEDSSVFQLKRM